MNQAVYFTNNQYHPRILDRVFHQIHEKSWDYCIQTQRSSCRHHMIGGDMNEFICDEELNQKLTMYGEACELIKPENYKYKNNGKDNCGINF